MSFLEFLFKHNHCRWYSLPINEDENVSGKSRGSNWFNEKSFASVMIRKRSVLE